MQFAWEGSAARAAKKPIATRRAAGLYAPTMARHLDIARITIPAL